jgi:hypothetical protein
MLHCCIVPFRDIDLIWISAIFIREGEIHYSQLHGKNADIHSAVESLQYVDVGSVADVSEVHATSIFLARVEWVNVHV